MILSAIQNSKPPLQDLNPTRGWSIVPPVTIAQERVLLLLAGLFTATGLVLLALVRTQSESAGIGSHVSPDLEARLLALSLAVWAACFAVIHWFLNRQQRARDPLLLPVAALLSGLGLIEIARLAPGFLGRQLGWLAVSTVVLLLVLSAPPISNGCGVINIHGCWWGWCCWR